MTEYIDREALGIGKCNPEVFEDKGYANGWNAAIEIILSAPAADVRPVTWIPVAERLPREGEFVLVYGDLYPNKHDGGVIAVSKRMDWNYWQGFGRERDITHWMPLPEPPKEGE